MGVCLDSLDKRTYVLLYYTAIGELYPIKAGDRVMSVRGLVSVVIGVS